MAFFLRLQIFFGEPCICSDSPWRGASFEVSPSPLLFRRQFPEDWEKVVATQRETGEIEISIFHQEESGWSREKETWGKNCHLSFSRVPRREWMIPLRFSVYKYAKTLFGGLREWARNLLDCRMTQWARDRCKHNPASFQERPAEIFRRSAFSGVRVVTCGFVCRHIYIFHRKRETGEKARSKALLRKVQNACGRHIWTTGKWTYKPAVTSLWGRSYLTSKFNSVTSITYVPMSLSSLKVTISRMFQGGRH